MYRATGHAQLGNAIDSLYNDRSIPYFADRVKWIVLSDEFDNMETGGLLELLYSRRWDSIPQFASDAAKDVTTTTGHGIPTLVYVS